MKIIKNNYVERPPFKLIDFHGCKSIFIVENGNEISEKYFFYPVSDGNGDYNYDKQLWRSVQCPCCGSFVKLNRLDEPINDPWPKFDGVFDGLTDESIKEYLKQVVEVKYPLNIVKTPPRN